MTPKKKIVEEFESGKAVPTQELAETFAEETQPAPQPEAAQPTRLIAYAAFDQDGKHYEPGDTFEIPRGWERDYAYDEFRGIQIKNKPGGKIGIAFTVPGEIINKKTQERMYSRQILPLKEA